MKCITICNPYPQLILLPEGDPRHKRVENRSWPTNYRGVLAIHAGKSNRYMRPGTEPGLDAWGLPTAGMPFGAIVGVVEVVGCFCKWQIRLGLASKPYPWLKEHRHVEGPWCHVYANPRRLVVPIFCTGAQGMFDTNDRRVGVTDEQILTGLEGAVA